MRRNASLHHDVGLMVSSYNLGRYASRLVASISVVGLVIAMAASTIG